VSLDTEAAPLDVNLAPFGLAEFGQPAPGAPMPHGHAVLEPSPKQNDVCSAADLRAVARTADVQVAGIVLGPHDSRARSGSAARAVGGDLRAGFAGAARRHDDVRLGRVERSVRERDLRNVDVVARRAGEWLSRFVTRNCVPSVSIDGAN
jgi:hypothetical protein